MKRGGAVNTQGFFNRDPSLAADRPVRYIHKVLAYIKDICGDKLITPKHVAAKSDS
jgi:hypothetical protein